MKIDVEKEYMSFANATVTATHQTDSGYKDNGLSTITIKNGGGAQLDCEYKPYNSGGLDELILTISGLESIGLLETIHEAIGALLGAVRGAK